MNKKIIIPAVLLVLIVGGIALFYFTNKKEQAVTQQNTSTNLPIGGQGNIINTSSSTDNTPTNITTAKTSLFQISQEPVSGYTAIKTSDGFSVRYVAKKDAHIYDVFIPDLTPVVVSDDTTAGIYDSILSPDGLYILQRSIGADDETIDSSLVKVAQQTGTSTTAKLTATNIGSYISDAVISPDGKSLFYLTKETSGSKGIVRTLATGKESTVFTSPIGSWLVSWPQKNTVTITTKPSSNVVGYMYSINTQTRVEKRVMNGNGLTTLMSPDASAVLYSDNNSELSGLNTSNGTITDFGIKSLPEKCVWSQKDKGVAYCLASRTVASGSYPDDWYQGDVSFSDDLYELNTVSTSSPKMALIGDFHYDYSKDIDGTNLVLSPNEDYLMFTDKNTGTVCAFKLF